MDDVLDTWFSSALWPFVTLGWPASAKTLAGKSKKNDLETFYPTDILTNDRGIINLWDARMIFSGLEFIGAPPFKDLLIHATILTKDGKRMSKSLGTGIDPVDLITKYGADATRFGLIWQAMGGQDIHWSEEHVVAGRKFCNKIWNAARFVLQQTPPGKKSDFGTPKKSDFEEGGNSKLGFDYASSADKKILAQLKKTKKDIARILTALHTI